MVAFALVVGIIVLASLVASGVIRPVGQGTLSAGATADPGGLAPKVVSAMRADIRSVVVLDGVIVADPPVPIKAVARGSVIAPVPAGTSVAKDAALLTLRTAGGEVVVRAPVDAVVTEVRAVEGEEVTIGATLAMLAPRAYQVVARIEPTLLYRFYGSPTEIVAKVQKGPAPFPCQLISLGIASASDARPLEAPVELRCRVPSDQRVFAGVRVDVGVTTGEAKGVVAIPVTAVEGQVDQGFVTVVDSSGARQRRAVRLGLSDGVLVEVTDGLAVGDKVLDLPPSLFPAGAQPTHAP